MKKKWLNNFKKRNCFDTKAVNYRSNPKIYYIYFKSNQIEKNNNKNLESVHYKLDIRTHIFD